MSTPNSSNSTVACGATAARSELALWIARCRFNRCRLFIAVLPFVCQVSGITGPSAGFHPPPDVPHSTADVNTCVPDNILSDCEPSGIISPQGINPKAQGREAHPVWRVGKTVRTLKGFHPIGAVILPRITSLRHLLLSHCFVNPIESFQGSEIRFSHSHRVRWRDPVLWGLSPSGNGTLKCFVYRILNADRSPSGMPGGSATGRATQVQRDPLPASQMRC